MKTIHRITISVLSSLLLLPLILQPLTALSIQPTQNYNIDASIIKQADNYNQPNSIIICPIFLQNDLFIADTEWYEGIFYYLAVRLNQGDFLAHYFVTKDGQILQGNSKGDEQGLPLASATTEKPIIIIYFSGTDQNDFTSAAKETMQQLILSVANNNAIKLNKVSIKNLSYQLIKDQPIALKFDILGGRWENSLKEMVAVVTPQYKPSIKQYTLEAGKINLPAQAVNYKDTVEIGVTVKNTSTLVLYQGSDYEPLISKLENNSSKFYLNGVWLSQTQAPLMPEGAMLKPGESKVFTIKFNIPLYFGVQKEEFQLINALGTPYPGSTFAVSIDIAHPAQEVVEITQTETGQLNVRDGPWASSSVIGKVTPGQRYIVLERKDSGYVKLDLGNGKIGWAVSRYTRIV